MSDQSYRAIWPNADSNTSALTNASTSSSRSRDSGSANKTGTPSTTSTTSTGDQKEPRRRRAGGTITNLACTQCRRARAKCDGTSPDACSRCASRNLTCTYEPHTKTQKDELINQLQTIRAREESVVLENQQYSIILDILTKYGHVDEIVRRLRNGDPVDAVVKWLGETEEFSAFVQRQTNHGGRTLVNAVQRIESMFKLDNSQLEAAKTWTTVTTNGRLVRHLLDLYFLWIHPNHMLFSEVSFLYDFLTGQDNRESYCSGPLVNAICAMACNVLHNASPEDTPISEYSARHELQRAFIDEARKGISQDSLSWLTTVQAFAVMFLVEISAGRARVASSYLRFAAEQLPTEVKGEYKPEVWEISRWGIHTLSTAWCAFTFQKPFNPQPQNAHIDLHISSDVGRGAIHPKEKEDLPRPSFAILVATFYANLFRIVHRTITMYCGTKGEVTGQEVLKRSNEYREWKDSLPDDLRLEIHGSISSPGSLDQETPTESSNHPLHPVVSLHLQYHTAVVGLFIPLYHAEGIQDEFKANIRDHLLKNGRRGLRILQHSARKHLRYGYLPMAMQSVLHLSDIIIKLSPSQDEREWAIKLCANTLEQNRNVFNLSGPLLQMFRANMRTIDRELSVCIDEIFGVEDQYSMDDLLEACTRLTYTVPTQQIMRLLSRNIENEWKQAVRDQPVSSPMTHSMRVDDILNTD